MKNKRTKLIRITAGLFAAVLICFIYTRFYGVTLFAKHSIGQSEVYSKEEIKDAMDQVEKKFKSTFNACYLTSLWYDENSSNLITNNSNEEIVLHSNYYVGITCGGINLNPGSTHEGWNWILVRSNGGEWELKDWGY